MKTFCRKKNCKEVQVITIDIQTLEIEGSSYRSKQLQTLHHYCSTDNVTSQPRKQTATNTTDKHAQLLIMHSVFQHAQCLQARTVSPSTQFDVAVGASIQQCNHFVQSTFGTLKMHLIIISPVSFNEKTLLLHVQREQTSQGCYSFLVGGRVCIV